MRPYPESRRVVKDTEDDDDHEDHSRFLHGADAFHFQRETDGDEAFDTDGREPFKHPTSHLLSLQPTGKHRFTGLPSSTWLSRTLAA